MQAKCGFGFIELGTVTPKPQKGNTKPRLFRNLPNQAIINRMGFNNKGVDYLVNQLKKSTKDIIRGVNIGKNVSTPIENASSDYLYCLEKVYPYCDYVVINISSPNTQKLRDLQLGDKRTALLTSISESRKYLASKHNRYLPILVKISPDLDEWQIGDMVRDISRAGLDGIICTNSTLNRPEPIADTEFGAKLGGLSGQLMAPLALSTLQTAVANRPKNNFLVVGCGGINSLDQGQAFLDAGADLIQIYSSFVFKGPFFIPELAKIH